MKFRGVEEPKRTGKRQRFCTGGRVRRTGSTFDIDVGDSKVNLPHVLKLLSVSSPVAASPDPDPRF